MSRNVSTANEAQLSSNHVNLAMFLELDCKSETVYISTLPCNFSWGGNTYAGSGGLGKVAAISEGIEVEAKGTQVSLSGVDQTLLGEALNDIQVGKAAKLYVGFFDEQANLIDTPMCIFSGIVDQPSIVLDPAQGTATISINLESSLIRLQRACNLMYIDADQRADYPDDSSMFQVNSLNWQALVWG